MIRPILGGRPVRVASGAVDVERFRFREKARAAFREEFELQRPTVLAVGQLIPRKGVATFFEAARASRGAIPLGRAEAKPPHLLQPPI